MTEQIQADAYETPFPHFILHNFYNDEELKLIWEELDFYTKPDKLLDVKEYLGVADKTNAFCKLVVPENQYVGRVFLVFAYKRNVFLMFFEEICNNIFTINRWYRWYYLYVWYEIVR